MSERRHEEVEHGLVELLRNPHKIADPNLRKEAFSILEAFSIVYDRAPRDPELLAPIGEPLQQSRSA